MSVSGEFVATLIGRASRAWAGFATSRLFELDPEAAARFGEDAFDRWKGHFHRRLSDLATALVMEEPRLFERAVIWERTAFLARGIPDGVLRSVLVALREVLQEELPEGARAAVARCLDPALAALDRPAEATGSPLNPGIAEGRLALTYLQALLEGDRQGALDLVVHAVEGGMPVERAYLEVLMPVQREVGRLWHDAKLGVDEERLVTATTQTAMAVLCRRAERAAPVGKTVVAASVPGDAHDIGIRAVTDFFELAGWRAIGLGADVPAVDLARAVERFEAELTVVSATLGEHLESAGEAIAAVRALPDRECRILVGGAAFEASEELWRRLGADARARTPPEAVLVGARLVGLDPAG